MDFKQKEIAAYNGYCLDWDALPAVDYKYFARIAELGRRKRAGAMSDVEVASRRQEYYDEYEQTRDKLSWTDIIKLTESCRICINGEQDPRLVAAVALRALWLITGDSMIEKKMREMEVMEYEHQAQP